MYISKWHCCFFIIILIGGCSQNQEPVSQDSDSEIISNNSLQQLNNDSNTVMNDSGTIDDKIGGINTTIIYTKQDTHSNRNLLVLPGWNYSKDRWCTETKLCQLALAQGFNLILPEMSKSMYISTIYPETKRDWQKYPTMIWVKDTFMPTLQSKYGLLKKDQQNYIVGLSTGGRGAFLIVNHFPGIFKKAALLSGDYDLTAMPQDNLATGFLGKYEQFKERWQGPENPVFWVSQLETPVYIGHGALDNIVPVTQSVILYEKIKQFNPDIAEKSILSIQENHTHNFDYWQSEVKSILSFFSEKD